MGEFFIPQRKKDMNLSSFFLNQDIKICINKIRKQHAYLISYLNLSPNDQEFFQVTVVIKYILTFVRFMEVY